MNAAKHASWSFCILILLACSGWYFASTAVPEKKLDEKTLAMTADAIVQGLTLRQFSPEGLLSQFLESESMLHIPNQNKHLLTNPHIVLQEGQDSWEIRSLKAEAIDKGRQITFLNKVVVHQDKTATTEESTFNTEKLLYFPKEKFATSDTDVVFKQQNSVVHSHGMNAYLNDKHVELLGKAQVIYKPRHA